MKDQEETQTFIMDTADQLVELMFSWIEKRENCAEQLKKLADELETLREKCNVAKCAGSTASMIGTASLIGAGVATIFTAGLAAPLLVIAGVVGGAGVAVSVGTKITELFLSSDTLKDAEKIEKENNEIAERIQNLFGQLKVEVKRMYPYADPDQVDRLVISAFMVAVARRSSRGLQIDFRRLANDCFPSTQPNKTSQLTKNVIVLVGLGVGVLGVLTFFTFKAKGKICQDLIETAVIRLTQKIAKTGVKTALKRGAMVVGAAVGLAFALYDAIDNWTDLIKNNHETEASRSVRDTADDILKTCRVLREELRDIEEKVRTWARNTRTGGQTVTSISSLWSLKRWIRS